MKRFLLLLMVMSFTSTSAFAYYEVKYNNAGSPDYTSSQFGSNALFTPKNRDINAQKRREFRRLYAETEAIKNMNNYNINLNVNSSTNKVQSTDDKVETKPAVEEKTPTIVEPKVETQATPTYCNGVKYYGDNPCSK